MGLSSAVDWWEEWQLRILVLGSLFVQFFLYFSDLVRRSPSLRKFRVFVWMAYVGGDALAIYALATLFNRHKQLTVDGGSSVLEVVWAPVLLIHLGGQPWITAYSLEDNELWKRHAITVVSQVTVALYVFCKWWSGEKRLLQVAVLLFVVGIIKFTQKPWILKRASLNNMLASAVAPSRVAQGPIGKCWHLCTAKFNGRHILRALKTFMRRETQGRYAYSLDAYVEQVNMCVQGRDGEEVPKITQLAYIYQMFVDLSATYTFRLQWLPVFLYLDNDSAYDDLQNEIKYIFQLLYTKFGTVSTLVGALPLILLPFLILASVVLFAMSHKDAYNDNDVKVTYILLCCTALEELLLIFSVFCAPCHKAYSGGWHGMVSQNNIMSFCRRKNQPTVLMNLAIFPCLREHLNEHWYIWQEPAARQITGLVRQHVRNGWEKYIRGNTSKYRRFHDFRGQHTLRRYGQLGWSLRMPFSESVVLWHLATDLCFHYPSTPPLGDATQRGREISNYMIYLLSTRPEMLMPGTAPHLVTDAGRCIQEVLENSKEPQENMVREIISTVKRGSTYGYGELVCYACSLAEELMKLDDSQRWTVIQGVWVEMLCYSASRCRGYLHAKSLGEGGEYLMTVWLHWSLMGMETLADKLQGPPLEEEKEEEEEEEETPEAAAEERPTLMGKEALDARLGVKPLPAEFKERLRRSVMGMETLGDWLHWVESPLVDEDKDEFAAWNRAAQAWNRAAQSADISPV